MTASDLSTPEAVAQVRAQAAASLKGITAGKWYYQHGHGIEVWVGGSVGLLIWAESGCLANSTDQELMAAAPTITITLIAALDALIASEAEHAKLTEAVNNANARYEFDTEQLQNRLEAVRRERNAAETELDQLKGKPPLSWAATRGYMMQVWNEALLSERTKLETKISKHSWLNAFPEAFAQASTPLLRDMLHMMLHDILRYQDLNVRVSEYALEDGQRRHTALQEMTERFAVAEAELGRLKGTLEFVADQAEQYRDDMVGNPNAYVSRIRQRVSSALAQFTAQEVPDVQ